MKTCSVIVVVILSCFISFINGFITPQNLLKGNINSNLSSNPAFVAPTAFKKQQTMYGLESIPLVLQRQRKSMAVVATQGLFGLGAAEIGIILVAAAFLLGPQKLAELGRDAGKMAGELKEVPKEFQKGIAEGEKEAQQLKEESKKQIEGAGVIKDVETIVDKK
jgi:sec-independent protein translocase protein TatA